MYDAALAEKSLSARTTTQRLVVLVMLGFVCLSYAYIVILLLLRRSGLFIP